MASGVCAISAARKDDCRRPRTAQEAAALKALIAVRPKYLAFIPEIDFGELQTIGPGPGRHAVVKMTGEAQQLPASALRRC